KLRTQSKRSRRRQKRAAKVATRWRLEAASSSVGRTDCALTERVIAQHERGHRLDHRHRARQNTRIVAAAGCESRLFARCADGFLFARNRRRRFERHSKINLFTV